MAMNSDSVRAFSDRLVKLMQARGFVSDRSRSGVDVAALAKGAGVSYEMARRYAEGLAMPRPDVLEAVARWLDVQPAALAFGEASGGIDPILLEQCVAAVSEAQKIARVELATGRAARIVSQLYAECRKGQEPSASSLAAMLRAMFNKSFFCSNR